MVHGAIRQHVPDWPDDYASRYRAAGYWQGKTFGRLLDELAAEHGSRTAIVDGNRRISFRQLSDRATALAVGLRERGISAGDAVILQVPNCAEFIEMWFALQRLGAIPVHAQPGHRHAEIGHLATATQATAYVTADAIGAFDHRSLAAQIADSVESIRSIIVVGDLGEYSADRRFVPIDALFVPGATIEDPSSPSDIALLLLSGGTTGMPKLIGRTHDDYLYNSRAAGERSALNSTSVYLAVLPIAFNYTWNCPGILGTLRVGGRVVLAPNPDAEECFELIERERVTMTAINPQLVPSWLDEKIWTTRDLSSLKIIEIGSARLADHHARRIVEEFDAQLQQILGMSEGLFCATRLDDDVELICTTQGLPVSDSDEIRVIDSFGRPLPDGKEGELTVRGPYTPRGYFNAPEHNRTAFTDDGFYRTGDLVRRLPSGHLIVTGRLKDQINRGGEKIAATEVESYLLSHPDIRSVALVGEPHDALGEQIVAFIVPEEHATDTSTLGRRELARFLKGAGLSAYKAPDVVHLIDHMPLTPLGKLDKNSLRKQLACQGQSAG